MTTYAPKSRYAVQVWINNALFADITGICENRQFIISRDKEDQISFNISIDKLNDLSKKLNIHIQDIFQSWLSEIRIVRNGVVQVAGELGPWNANIGADRKININAYGWFYLMKFRRTSDEYTSKSALYIAQDLLTKTLARTNGSSGNYNGLTIGAVPGVDTTNVYADQKYDNKTIYDAIYEMSQEVNGFDFEFTYDKKFNIYTPSIGVDRSDIVFTYPNGNVKDIQYQVDPSNSFNSLLARGKGSGVNQLTTTVSNIASQLTYGLREDTKDYSNIASPDQLLNIAQSDQNVYKTPIILHKIVFDGSGARGAPQVGSFHIGDTHKIAVKNFNLYQDINQSFRIDQIQVVIGNNDEEDVTLSVSVPGT